MITEKTSLCNHRISDYCAPEMSFIEISSEGVLCYSGTEGLEEEEGIW